MKVSVPPLNNEAADQIASILIESGLDAPKPVRRRTAGASRTRRGAPPQRRGFIDLAWKLGVASGTTLLISSLGWGVAYSNHDRTVRAETRAAIEIEYRHQAELNQLEAQRNMEVARRHAAEEARFTLQMEQWARQQQEDESKLQEREQEWQTVGAEIAANVQAAMEIGDHRKATMELYYLARRMETLPPDDDQIRERFIELVHEWIDSLNETPTNKDNADGIS